MNKPVCVLLWLLSLLSTLRVRVAAEGSALTPIQLAPVPCNDKAVEKLSRLATTYINEDRAEGYKFALNRVANVHLHAQGPAGNVYYLDLDVLETKCHISSQRSWKRCEVRPFMETRISGNCNTTILHTPEGYTYLYSYDCTLVPDPPEKLQQICPTCPLLLPPDSEEAVEAAGIAMASYKRQSTLGADLGVLKIIRAASQSLPVKGRFVEFMVQECPEGLTERGTCQRLTLKSDTEAAGFCVASVIGDSDPEVQVSCEMLGTQNVDVLRPAQPQGNNFHMGPGIPTSSPIYDSGIYPEPVPSDPKLLPDVKPWPLDPEPINPVPIHPIPIHPDSINPVPIHPIPIHPDPINPVPIHPIPIHPDPINPVPIHPIPIHPDPINPIPIHPIPINPAPMDPVPINPVPGDPVPSDPSVAVNPYQPGDSSSDSAEGDGIQLQRPPAASPYGSSSEEIEGIVALRPPLDFHYRRHDRKRRQALQTTSPSHKPVFLSDFPSGSSPFRSCPGPFRYTTV